MTDEKIKESQEVEYLDKYLRGAYMTPYTGVTYFLYIVCAISMFSFFIWKAYFIGDYDISFLFGAGLVVGFLIIAVIATNIPIVNFLIPFAIEYFWFDITVAEFSLFAQLLASVLCIYTILFLHSFSNFSRFSRGEDPEPLLPENPRAKKTLDETLSGNSTPGFQSINISATLFGLSLVLALLLVVSFGIGGTILTPAVVATFFSLIPILFTLLYGLSLIYVQKDASVGQAFRLVSVYTLLIIFGFAIVYNNMYFGDQELKCLNYPEGMGSTFRDHLFSGLYFSVVTFTTLGYGDVQPQNLCRLVAMSEAVCGILFTPMFIVFLVSVVSRQERKRE